MYTSVQVPEQMPHQTAERLFSLFGLVLSGDFDSITMFRSKRGKVVWFSKTWPDQPPSPLQIEQRARMSTAADLWQQLSLSEKAQWDLATRRASLCMHGYDLWQHWKLTGDDSAIQTLQRQTGTNLLPP